MKLFLLQALVFFAAFLIFQVELILGKIILPGFGGGYLVWGISVVFYQGLLFFGYVYIHFFNQWFRFSTFRKVQTVLVLGSLLLLPLDVAHLKNPGYQVPMVIEIVWMLALTVGLMFFVLSGLSVYTQVHLSATNLPEKKNPYVLFAASNLGAFASLLGYPLIWEPNFTLSEQLFYWELGYALVAVLFVVMQVWVVPQPAEKPSGTKMLACRPGQMMQWLLLAAAPSAMFLAVTNEITFNIAPVPLLWVIPLAIYLLTLVLSFMKRPFCPQWLQNNFYFFISLGVALFLFKATGNNLIEYGIILLISLRSTHYWALLAAEPALLLTICFVFCLVCHYRLNQSRPTDPGQLTTFYIVLAAGGFLGGMIVNWIVPLIFTDTVELLISFLIATAGFMLATNRAAKPRSFRFVFLIAGLIAIPLLWRLALNGMGPENGMSIALVAGSLVLVLFYLLKSDARWFTYAMAGMIVVVPMLDGFFADHKTLMKTRSYYGVYSVYETLNFRKMKHGMVMHGAQFLDPDRQTEPLTYFHPKSPLGEVLAQHTIPAFKVGIVGLGVGTLTAYAREGDQYDLFEIDPMVGTIANDYFTFLDNSRGQVRTIYGDGRVSLRKEPDERYDILVLDAFNSGSIPVHLMTVDAIEEYLRVLKPEGVLFFNITNAFLDIGPILAANARQLGLLATFKYTPTVKAPEQEATSWMVLTRSREVHAKFLNDLKWREYPVTLHQAWTDQYSSLWSVLNR